MVTILILLGLTFIIFIHELGHFLVARWVGVKVFTFSVGFGPRLISFGKDKKGTEYILSLIPLGGYVRLKGQEDLPTKIAEGKIDDDHYLTKSPIKRLMIILAGVTMNLISAYFFIVIAYSIGVSFISNKVGGFSPEVPTKLVNGEVSSVSGLQIGDEIIKVGNEVTESFEDVMTAVALNNDWKSNPVLNSSKNLSKNLAGENQSTEITVLRKGRTLNLNVPLMITKATDGVGFSVPRLGVIPATAPIIKKLNEKSSLHLVNHVRAGDKIVYLEGKNGVKKRTISGILEYIRQHPGEIVKFKVYLSVESEPVLVENILIDTREVPELGFSYAPVVEVVDNHPAARVGIKNGDRIIGINSVTVNTWEELIERLQPNDKGEVLVKIEREKLDKSKKEPDVLSFVVHPEYNVISERYFLGVRQYQKNDKGVEVSEISEAMKKQVPGIRVEDRILQLKNQGELVNARVIRENNTIDFSYNPNLLGKKEIGYLFDLTSEGKVISYSLGKALWKSLIHTGKEFKEVVSFFTGLVSGSVPLEVVGGPIAVFEASQTVASSRGWSYFILLLAKISISLIFINLLPIPVLDGGHAVLIFYEMVRGKPLPEYLVRSMQFVGFVLLVTFMIYVNYNDVIRLINR